MSKTRYVNTIVWSDPWMVDKLNPLDRYLFLYLLTNAHTTIAGVYEVSLRTMSFETGIEKEELIRMLKRLEPKVRYLDGWVVMTNGIKNQNYNSPKIKTGIELVLAKCPESLIKYINFPKDFNYERPAENPQTELLLSEFDQNSVDNRTTVEKMPVVNNEKDTPVRYGIDTLSHSKANVNTKSKPNVKADAPTIAGTTGLKKLEGRSYTDINILFDDFKVQGLVNEEFKAWYCKAFFKLGRDRVLVLASQAKADGNDPLKLFSHLLTKESGVKK